MIEGAIIEPIQGSGSGIDINPGWRTACLPWALISNPVGFTEGMALLNPDRLHNNRLHTNATALSSILLAVASRLRWPSEVDQGGAGEPHAVLRT